MHRASCGKDPSTPRCSTSSLPSSSVGLCRMRKHHPGNPSSVWKIKNKTLNYLQIFFRQDSTKSIFSFENFNCYAATCLAISMFFSSSSCLFLPSQRRHCALFYSHFNQHKSNGECGDFDVGRLLTAFVCTNTRAVFVFDS